MPAPSKGRRLRTYLIGATVSRTGDEMIGPALLLLALAATDACFGALSRRRPGR